MIDYDFCQTVHFLLRTHLSIIARDRDSADDAGFSTAKVLSTTHRQLLNYLMSLESPTSKRDNFGDASSMQDASTLASLSALSLSSDISIVNQKKNKIGKNLTSLFQSRKQLSKGELSAGVLNQDSHSHDGSFSSSYSPSHARNGDGIKVGLKPAMPSIPVPATSPKGPKSILKKTPIPAQCHSLHVIEVPPIATLFENMNNFLSSLDGLCTVVEKALLKSFSQKVTEWALQPWSSRKDKALADATTEMRNRLVILDGYECNDGIASQGKWSPIMNPVNSSEYLVSIDSDKSYILPSAHFPILLSFRVILPELSMGNGFNINSFNSNNANYGIKVEFLSVRDLSIMNGTAANTSYIVHAAVAGIVQKTEKW
jgi:hypothetical protein